MSVDEMVERVQYLAAIVDSSADAIFTHDLAGTVTTWNRAAEELFGYPSDDVIGRPLSELGILGTAPEMTPGLDCMESGKNTSQYQAVGKHRTGSEFPVSVTQSTIVDETRRILGNSRSVRKISERSDASEVRKQIHCEFEQALQQRQAQLEAETSERKRVEDLFHLVVEVASNAILMVGADGRISLANSQSEKLFGYDRGQLVGQKIETLVPERLRGTHNADGSAFFDARSPNPVGSRRDLFGIRKDGTEVAIEIGLNPIITAEGPFVLTSIIDITECRTEDEVTAAKLELESRNRELETMLHVTSHDLREPLRAIRSFSLILSERYGNQIDDRGKDLLQRVLSGAERLDRLIQDILNVAKARRILPPGGLIPSRAIVADAMRVLSSRIAETHAHVQIADKLPYLRVSLVWGSVAVQNLVANALKFTPDNTRPEIEICGYENDKDREVGLMIRDRGIGVPVRHAERIFELFQRAVGREVEGTGAGLAIVRQIAERHGGRAWVQNRDGGGSDFIITFGRVPRQQACVVGVN